MNGSLSYPVGIRRDALQRSGLHLSTTPAR